MIWKCVAFWQLTHNHVQSMAEPWPTNRIGPWNFRWCFNRDGSGYQKNIGTKMLLELCPFHITFLILQRTQKRLSAYWVLGWKVNGLSISVFVSNSSATGCFSWRFFSGSIRMHPTGRANRIDASGKWKQPRRLILGQRSLPRFPKHHMPYQLHIIPYGAVPS